LCWRRLQTKTLDPPLEKKTKIRTYTDGDERKRRLKFLERVVSANARRGRRVNSGGNAKGKKNKREPHTTKKHKINKIKITPETGVASEAGIKKRIKPGWFF